MSGVTLRCVWPVVDDTYRQSELVAEAWESIGDLIAQAHAVIAGPPRWSVELAHEVDGWQAYAPGLLLVADVPVRPVVPMSRWRTAA